VRVLPERLAQRLDVADPDVRHVFSYLRLGLPRAASSDFTA
jgi:hypothetical protein